MELGELALKDLKDMNRDDIMMMFRVSKTMLGISEGVNLNNARESRAMFKESITMAEWDRLVDHLNAFLLPMFGEDTDRVEIQYEHPDLQSGTDKVNEWTAGVNKWLTVNDIRKERNLPPVDGGDVIYQSIGLIPLTEESATPLSERPQNNPQDNNNPNDNGNNNPNDNQNNDKKPPKDEKPKKNVKKKGLSPQQSELFFELLYNVEKVWTPQYRKLIRQELKKQEKEILERHEQKSFPEWLFDVEVSKNRLIGKLLPAGIEIMRQAAKIALGIIDDIDTEFEINQRITTYVKDRVSRMATAMNEETLAQLQATIAQGVKDGENLAKLTNRVKEVFSTASDTRAELIARTETLAASNEGTLEAYRQSPLVNAKEWTANPGACEFCQSFDGLIVEIDSDFAKEGTEVTGKDGNQYTVSYEDVGHPPLHPNCRCALLPVILEG